MTKRNVGGLLFTVFLAVCIAYMLYSYLLTDHYLNNPAFISRELSGTISDYSNNKGIVKIRIGQTEHVFFPDPIQNRPEYTQKFQSVVKLGDSIYKFANSDSITIVKSNGEEYSWHLPLK